MTTVDLGVRSGSLGVDWEEAISRVGRAVWLCTPMAVETSWAE